MAKQHISFYSSKFEAKESGVTRTVVFCFEISDTPPTDEKPKTIDNKTLNKRLYKRWQGLVDDEINLHFKI